MKRFSNSRPRGRTGLGALAMAAVLISSLVACDKDPIAPPGMAPATESGSEEPTPEPVVEAQPEPEPVVEPEPEPEPPPVPPDFQIATRIRLRLVADTDTRDDRIQARVRAGEVWLSGEVESGLAVLRAETITRATYGVTTVHNELQGPEPTDEDRAAAAPNDEILVLEPGFATEITNYASGERVQAIEIITRPVDDETGQLPVQDDAEIDDVTEPAPEPGPTEPPTEDTETTSADPSPAEVARDNPVETSTSAHQTYEVQRGDSLWNIAADHMSAGDRWQELYEANREVIGDDPMNLRAGLVLRIPD